jgi:hypothetical protein
MGPVLVHVATIDADVPGQAFAWARDGTRTIFAIDRQTRVVKILDVPEIAVAPNAEALRFR